MPPRLLTAEELALRWRVPKAQVYRMARNGLVPKIKLGPRYVRFDIRAIEEFERTGGTSHS